MKRRSADTLRKRLNLTEAQVFDLDAAKEIAKQGKDNCERVNGVVAEESVELLRYWRRKFERVLKGLMLEMSLSFFACYSGHFNYQLC